MDSIFHPEERLWVSQEIVIGETLSRLNDKYQVFFSDLEEVRRENPDLFKPLEASRPSQEELAALLKPYDHIYEKPKKSKKKNKAISDDNDEVVEPEIVVEDQQVIENDINVDSSSDISDSEIKLQLVSLDIDDGHGNCTVVANPEPNTTNTNTTVLLDSDEGEDFFTDFGHFKSSLYTNYVQDLKKRTRKRVKNPIDYDGLDGESTDTDEDYECEEISAESGETSEESDTDGETMDTDTDESEESDGEIKIDDGNKQKNGVSVDIFGTKSGKKETSAGDSDGRKVDLNGGKINKDNDNDGFIGVGGRPRRSVAAYALAAFAKVKVKAKADSSSSEVKNEKVSTAPVPPKLKGRTGATANVYVVQDGQLPGTSSSDATPQPGTSRPGPSKSKSTDVYIHDGQIAGSSSSILKKNSLNLPSSSKTNAKTTKKIVTISDDKKDKDQGQNQNQNPEEEALRREMVSFMNFFENSYKVKLAELKNYLMEDREVFKKAFNVDDKEFKEMQRAINPSLLTIPEEFLMDSPIMKLGSMPVLFGPIPTTGSKKSSSLAMLKFANLGRLLSHEDWYWKSPIVLDQMTMDQEVSDRLLRTRESKLRQGEEMRKPLGIRNPNLVDKDEFIFTIRVYQNFRNDDIVADQFNLNLEPKFLYEIQVLGNQTVAELRQMLTCENDYVCLESFAHPLQYDPEDERKLAKNCYNGSIICIGNKLYVDPENEHSEMMARSVIDWGKGNKAGKLGPFEITSLFDTKIKDLVIRFGYPYVFIHLGNCEHLMVFTTSKMITAEDRLEKSMYPRRSVYGKFRIINCNIDNENMAKWAVIGCDRFPSSQMMICGDCLLAYCYDAEAKKIGDFHLFPIINIAGKI